MVNREEILSRALYRASEISKRNLCEDKLYRFLEDGFRYIDPAKFKGGWHLEAISEHLEAVTRGQIRRLVINIPPRCSKSSIVSVAWPAWVWAQKPETGPLAGPGIQFLTSSYAQTLSMRDSVKMRRLIESPWYQKQWGDRFILTGDQNTKTRFENNHGGYRLSTSVGGTTTGEGGNVVIIDDPMSAGDVASETEIGNVTTWWDEVMSSRLNDPEKDAFVVIMQRLHQEDLTGHIMDREMEDWTWLCLPMEFEEDRRCTTMIDGHEFWTDPRVDEGDLLCPNRFSKESVDRIARSMGPFQASGQLQQSPTPKGGGIIKEEWWLPWSDPLDNTKNPGYPAIEFVLAALDTAYTEKEENDPSALTIWGVFRDEHGNPKVILMYGWSERLEFSDLVEKVMDTCTTTKKANPKSKYRFPVDRLIIESKASGLSVYQEIHKQIQISGKFGVELFDPKKYGDKTARLYSVQHLFSSDMIYVPWIYPLGFTWVNEVIQQVSLFPKAKHDDYVDTVSMALRYLRDMGFALTIDEHAIDEASEYQYSPGSNVPLYPVYSNG